MSQSGQVSGQEPTLNLKLSERRNSLFAYLGHVIRVSHEKMGSKGNSDSAKLSWGRLMVSAIVAYGGLLKDSEFDDIEARLLVLEQRDQKTDVLEKWKWINEKRYR